MMKRRNILVIFAIALSLSAFCSCGNIREISVVDYKIESLNPRGLRSVDAVVYLFIHNPSIGFQLSDVQALIKREGVPLATFTTDGLKLVRKSDLEYPLSLNGSLDKNVSLMQLLKLPSAKPEELTIDLDVKVKLNFLGLSKKIRIRDYNLAKLLEEDEDTKKK